jgi:hypothetical protein
MTSHLKLGKPENFIQPLFAKNIFKISEGYHTKLPIKKNMFNQSIVHITKKAEKDA